MPVETPDLLTEVRNAVALLREKASEAEAERKTLGEERQEVKNTLATLQNRLDEVELAGKRPRLSFGKATWGGGETPDPQIAFQAKAAMFKALRSPDGVRSLSDDDRKAIKIVSMTDAKALSTGDDTAGGYLAPSDYEREIIKGVIEFSPVRSLARVTPIGMRSLVIPKRTGTFAAAWVSETGTRSERTGLTYGAEEIHAHELYAEVLFSEQMMEDAVFDIETEIRMECEEQLGVAEATAFISGSGVGRPEGILTNANVTVVNSGDADEVTADGLILALHTPKGVYSRNGTWLMNRDVIRKTRTLKGGDGHYLWDPQIGLSAGNPPTILGRPYEEATDLATEAADAKIAIFGDFRRGYRIVDRVNMVVKRLNEKYAESGQIAVIVRKRVGGQVVQSEALCVLKCHT